ncbi:hypothetical protein MRB53_022951 [Persea americana]|uniref:Uncharacterized protein n=1 Tax=Persea americana TaxID=3435 RepID=A0ACC2L8Y2_PERAE|nr:hypothetical protein MRB53_022951 [Persea americana]
MLVSFVVKIMVEASFKDALSQRRQVSERYWLRTTPSSSNVSASSSNLFEEQQRRGSRGFRTAALRLCVLENRKRGVSSIHTIFHGCAVGGRYPRVDIVWPCKKRGDALVSYLKEPFVSLAIQLLDGTPLCPGGKIPMSVSIAKFEQKGDAFIAKQMDKKKKKKLKRVEDKILGWGMNFERRHMLALHNHSVGILLLLRLSVQMSLMKLGLP